MQENIRFLLSMEICCYILVIFICCWPKRVKCKPFHMIWKKPQKTCNFHNWHKKGQWGVRRLINWHKKGSEDLITGKKNLSRGGWGGGLGSKDLRWDNGRVGVWAEQSPAPGLYVCKGLGGYSTEGTSEHLQITGDIVIEDIVITLVAVIVNIP